ncbi:terminase large subunit domain-containing protein [Moraxella sp. ZY210820]|uniref:terminase large subunit domain-containing protein n=1 Tax=Moraxella sp. ZY210820 TaxID=2904123 RepID=UPI0027319196|nr:terminase family protein [Moraxella sp. ZY210820]WLF84827.1 terminase large subunit [Moraxella sp. ZY210820]
MMNPKLNIPQAKFLQMPNKFRAFVAGFGSGKTWVGSSALCIHAWNSPKVPSGYFGATYPQIRDIFYPTIEECAFHFGLRVDIKTSNKEVHFYSGSIYRGTTICRSMDNPSSIVGFKVGKSLVDELDTLNEGKATESWRKIIARHRASSCELDFDETAITKENEIEIVRNTNGIDVTTTPEGFRFTYKQFVKAPGENKDIAHFYGLIQASTYDNEKNLPPDYIESLRQSYPPQLIEAYLNGQFVNLASGAVYPDFDRHLNKSFETIQDGDILHIGMDFNVLKMACVVYVMRGNVPHAVDELVGVRDTPTMCQLLKQRYPNHMIYIYPDASGQNTSSKSSSVSDHSIIRQHGFVIKVASTNPSIKDRLNAMNAMILNSQGERRFFVNPLRCPEYTDALEQQIFDKFGIPDKSTGLDHVNDAGGYFIAYQFPISKPITRSFVDMPY